MTYLDLTRADLFLVKGYDAYFAHLRQNSPVFWDHDVSRWMITGYDEVAEAYVNGALSSAQGTILGGSINNAVDSASNKMLICSDDPAHQRLRKFCAPTFFREAVSEAMRSTAFYLAEEFDRLPKREPIDFLSTVLRTIPIGFLQSCFPMSFGDAREIVSLTQDLILHANIRALPADTTRAADRRSVAHLRLLLAVRDRYKHCTDDGVRTALDSDGQQASLNSDEIIYNLLNIAVGGNETTPFTAAAITYEILTGDTDRYLGVYRQDRAAFLSEVLRWTTTNAYVQRHACIETAIGDVKINEGDFVLLWNYAANRDERYFWSTFSPEVRHPVPHLTFGRGKHRCIGANVAHAELETYLDFLVDRIDRIRPLAPPAILQSNFMRGYTSLPVEITR